MPAAEHGGLQSQPHRTRVAQGFATTVALAHPD